MTKHPFRILNVFAIDGDPFSGNPLCVFENGSQLSSDQMQSLARQFNLSETTFVLRASSDAATARVRIFTPTFEMPFAGHPTLGSAHVVCDLGSNEKAVVLEMKAGLVDVTARSFETMRGTWTFRPARSPKTRAPEATPEEIATMLGLPADAIAGTPLRVDTGVEQLVIPLARAEDVARARPDLQSLARLGVSELRDAYVFARLDASHVIARYFFVSNGSVIEDPATGSACANLGGWLVATGASLPVRVEIRQGDAVLRPSILELHVDETQRIFVSGRVVEIGRGTIAL